MARADSDGAQRCCGRCASAILVAGVALLASWAPRAAQASSLSPVPDHVGYTQFLLFPQKSSGMGVFLALSVPLDSLNHDVSLAYNFEANYQLPTNATALTEMEAQYGYKRSERSLAEDSTPPARSLRDVGRADVYAMLMGSIARAGLPGRECLLRAVCEASEWPMAEGLLGNLLAVLLTPSSSIDDVHPGFHEAERRGRRGADCALHYNDCPTSLLALLTEYNQ